MSQRYLAEHVPNALLALELAEKEAAHLGFTHRTLFAQPIDLPWVRALPEHEELSEKIEAFVSRFGRLQDHIGEKLLPRFSRLLGEQPKSLLDTLAYAEKMGWLDDADAFVSARKLRNLLVHEYMSDPETFFETLQAADAATRRLTEVVNRLRDFVVELGLICRP